MFLLIHLRAKKESMKTSSLILLSLGLLLFSCGSNTETPAEQQERLSLYEQQLENYNSKIARGNKLLNQLDKLGYQFREGQDAIDFDEVKDVHLLPEKECKSALKKLKDFEKTSDEAREIFDVYLRDQAPDKFHRTHQRAVRFHAISKRHMLKIDCIANRGSDEEQEFKVLSHHLNKTTKIEFQSHKAGQAFYFDRGFSRFKNVSQIQAHLDALETFLFKAKKIQNIDQLEYVKLRIDEATSMQTKFLEILMNVNQ